jgi:hypothetical protein
VGKLRGRIAPKKTDAARLIIGELSQLPRTDPLLLMNPAPETPILAEEAIEGTGLVEDGQILVAILRALGIGKPRIPGVRSPGANPISHAVRWKAIIVPPQVPFL